MSHFRKGSIPVLSRNTHDATFMLQKKPISFSYEILNASLKSCRCPLPVIGESPWQSRLVHRTTSYTHVPGWRTSWSLQRILQKPVPPLSTQSLTLNSQIGTINTRWGYNKNESSDAKIEIWKMQWRKKHFPYGQGDLISKLEESTFLIKKKNCTQVSFIQQKYHEWNFREKNRKSLGRHLRKLYQFMDCDSSTWSVWHLIESMTRLALNAHRSKTRKKEARLSKHEVENDGCKD